MEMVVESGWRRFSRVLVWGVTIDFSQVLWGRERARGSDIFVSLLSCPLFELFGVLERSSDAGMTSPSGLSPTRNRLPTCIIRKIIWRRP